MVKKFPTLLVCVSLSALLTATACSGDETGGQAPAPPHVDAADVATDADTQDAATLDGGDGGGDSANPEDAQPSDGSTDALDGGADIEIGADIDPSVPLEVRSIAQNTAALCDYLAQHNDEVADRDAFVVEVGALRYPVLNAAVTFAAHPGSDDQTVPLQAALDGTTYDRPVQDGLVDPSTLRGPTVLFLPRVGSEGTYVYSQILTLANDNVAVCGTDVTLFADDPDLSSFRIEGNNVHVHGLRMRGQAIAITDWPERFDALGDPQPSKYANGVSFSGAGSSSSFVLQGASHVVVSHTDTLGGGRGGFRLYRSEEVLLYGNRIERTHSDSIHIAHASNHVTVLDNHVVNSGDDCISVVPYNAETPGPTVTDVYIRGNRCEGSRARGLTAIGGENLTYRDNEVSDTLTTGILIYPAGDFSAGDAQDITVEGNTVARASLGERIPHAGGIGMMGGATGAVRNVIVRNNTVSDTYTTGFGQIRLKHCSSGCTPGADISILDNTLAGDLPALALDTNAYENVFQSGNTYNGAGVSPSGTDGQPSGATYDGVEPGALGSVDAIVVH